MWHSQLRFHFGLILLVLVFVKDPVSSDVTKSGQIVGCRRNASAVFTLGDMYRNVSCSFSLVVASNNMMVIHCDGNSQCTMPLMNVTFLRLFGFRFRSCDAQTAGSYLVNVTCGEIIQSRRRTLVVYDRPSTPVIGPSRLPQGCGFHCSSNATTLPSAWQNPLTYTWAVNSDSLNDTSDSHVTITNQDGGSRLLLSPCPDLSEEALNVTCVSREQGTEVDYSVSNTVQITAAQLESTADDELVFTTDPSPGMVAAPLDETTTAASYMLYIIAGLLVCTIITAFVLAVWFRKFRKTPESKIKRQFSTTTITFRNHSTAGSCAMTSSLYTPSFRGLDSATLSRRGDTWRSQQAYAESVTSSAVGAPPAAVAVTLAEEEDFDDEVTRPENSPYYPEPSTSTSACVTPRSLHVTDIE